MKEEWCNIMSGLATKKTEVPKFSNFPFVAEHWLLLIMYARDCCVLMISVLMH